MKEAICILLSMSIFLSGCGGHAANPVDRYMLGDEKKSCNSLYAEVSQLDDEIILKNKEITDRETWNIILFVGGFFIIVPWFFIDCKKSQEVELDALKARKTALMNYYYEKGCEKKAG